MTLTLKRPRNPVHNRVAGIEFNLASRDNRWTGKAFYHQAFYPTARATAFRCRG